MMKYLKKFINENYDIKSYRKGNYILIDNSNEYLYPIAIIIKKFDRRNYEQVDRYLVKLLFPNKLHWKHKYDDEHTTVVSEYQIIKKLNKTEFDKLVVELKIKFDADKYNL